MYGQFDNGGGDWPGSRPGLGRVDARLLWALRRLALMQPLGAARCPMVHIALQQDFGEAGLGIEHLLRCWLVGLARFADRPLCFGTPVCAAPLPDEALLLRILAAPDAEAAALLIRLAGPRAATLLPLARAVRSLVENIS
jgi:hypothetical protein